MTAKNANLNSKKCKFKCPDILELLVTCPTMASTMGLTVKFQRREDMMSHHTLIRFQGQKLWMQVTRIAWCFRLSGSYLASQNWLPWLTSQAKFGSCQFNSTRVKGSYFICQTWFSFVINLTVAVCQSGLHIHHVNL